MLKIKVYADKAGKWRWALKAANGKKIAASGESFARKHNAVRAAVLISGHLGTPHVVESLSGVIATKRAWIDVPRLKQALKGSTFTLPPELTREEVSEFIRAHAPKKP